VNLGGNTLAVSAVKAFLMVGPFEKLGDRPVVVVNECRDFGL